MKNINKEAIKQTYKHLSISNSPDHQSISIDGDKSERVVNIPIDFIPEGIEPKEGWNFRLSISGTCKGIGKQGVEVCLTDHSCSIDKPMDKKSELEAHPC